MTQKEESMKLLKTALTPPLAAISIVLAAALPYFATTSEAFAASQAIWTFRVDPEKGRFADGTTEKTFEIEVGSEAPETPVPVANADWYVTGWDRTVPIVADSAGEQEFNVTFIPYRVIRYYDSHVADGGAKDGTSWENAYDKLHLALQAAESQTEAYLTELRVKRGIHVPQGNKRAKMSFSKVQLVGGFTGNGDERVTDRRATIFCGDLKADDVYLDLHGNVLGRVMNDDGTFFDFASAEAEDDCILLDTTVATKTDASNYEALLGAAKINFSDGRIEGLTFTGYSSVFTTAGDNIVSVTNCDFVGCFGSTISAPQYSDSMGIRVSDCGFYGQNGRAVNLAYLKSNSGASATVDHCTFGWFCSRGCAMGDTGVYVCYGTLDLEDCTFEHFYSSFCQLEGQTPGATQRTALAGEGGDYSSGVLHMRRCTVSDIRMPDNVKDNYLVRLRSGGSVISGCTFENIVFGETYVSGNANKIKAHSLIAAPGVSDTTFRNMTLSVDSSGDAGVVSLVAVGVSSAADDMRFEKVTVDSTQNGRVALLSVGTNKASGSVGGEGRFVDCRASTSGSGIASLVCPRYDTSSLAADTTYFINGIGRYAVCNNEVSAPNGTRAILIEYLKGSSDGLSVCNNKIVGGSAYAAVIFQMSSSLTLRNVTVAGNVLSDYGETAIAATIVRGSNFLLDIGWSTFYNNAAAYEIYYTPGKWTEKTTLTSSVVANDIAEGWTAYGSTLTTSLKSLGVHMKNSYFQDLPSSYQTIVSGFNAYTEVPQLVGPVKRRRDKRLFVYHTPKSPYAKGNPELVGVYDADLAATDAVGAERPEEDVRIGAVQETYLPPGMMLFVR